MDNQLQFSSFLRSAKRGLNKSLTIRTSALLKTTFLFDWNRLNLALKLQLAELQAETSPLISKGLAPARAHLERW